MVSLQQRFLIAAMIMAAATCFAEKMSRFRPDDSLLQEPASRNIGQLKGWDIDDIYDFIEQTFVEPRREKVEKLRPHPACNINTLGEVPNSAWYTNRHVLNRMSIDELVRGPGNSSPPDATAPWRVISGKGNGISPGFLIEDRQRRRYLLKFDSSRDPETASAADVIVSKFMYALGYNVPEDYIVYFRRDQLALNGSSTYRDSAGRKRRLAATDVEAMLRPLPKDTDGRYRALASRRIEGKILGPFQYSGMRSDDPNDIVPHEDRRELRGLRVFDAWLNNTDAKAENSLDTIVEQNGRRFIRHYLIDFTGALGTDGFDAKDPRLGHEYFVDLKPAGVQIFTLGLYVPRWMRASYPHITGVGHFESRVFDPLEWKPNYPNPAFDLMDRDDAFWAAKQVAAFTDEEIRAIVNAGRFSDPRAADWIEKCLIERRDKVPRAFLSGTLPVDHFRVEGRRLRFTVLPPWTSVGENWTIRWSTLDSQTGAISSLPAIEGPDVTAALRAAPGAEFLAADITSADGPNGSCVRVYLRRAGDSADVVGIERSWGKSSDDKHSSRKPGNG